MEEDKKKNQRRWLVVGLNILGLLCYTLIFRFLDGGIILDCFIIAMHFFACLIAAAALEKKWEWLLSAFLVVAIGFSTCVTFVASYHS